MADPLSALPAALPVPLRRAWARMEERWQALAPNVRGAVWVTLAAFLFTVMATLIKALGPRYDSLEIVFFRCLFALLIVLPFAWRVGPAALRTQRPQLHLARALVGVLSTFATYYGITKLALADATAISFTRSLFMIVLAVLFLGERVHAARGIATVVGFMGVLVMLRPLGEGPVFAMLVALLGSAFTAGGIVLVKKLAETESPVTILVFYNLASTLVALPPAIPVWRTPTLLDLALLALVAAFSGAGQFCTIRGYGAAEASAVVPFGYSRMLFAGLLGFLLFAEVPDRWSLAGAAIIIASTLYIGLRESKRAKRAWPRPGA